MTEASELAAPQGPAAIPVALVVGECPGAIRLIGVLDPNEQDCTLGGNVPAEWSASDLFYEGSPGVTALSGAIPAELERYCAFDYVGPEDQVASHYAALTNAVIASPHMDATTLSADCRGEYEQGDLYDASIGGELHESLLANIGWQSGQWLVDGDAHEIREMAEVAVVDTVSQEAADDPNIDPTSPHGLQMAELIREVDCPAGGSSCLDAVHHILALPRDDGASEPDWVAGGRHGSQGDLAMAIYEAVEGWRERRLANTTSSAPRLVINLSVGWTGLEDELLESTRGPHAAVLAAAYYASCNGALMIAASGNADDELCPEDSEGPLAPARFEAIAAPTQAECATLGYVPQWTGNYPIFNGNSGYRPLIHAVSGVDPYDNPLLNARGSSSARIAALGLTGISDPTGEALAGSSVAAALTSGAAAMLWSFRPDLTPDEVMDIIHTAGWDTTRDADFGLPGSTESVHRLAVCPALAAACQGADDDDCPTPSCYATTPATDGNLSQVASAVDAVLTDPNTTVETFVSAAVEEFPVCGGDVGGTTDLASPQPELPICPHCDLGTGNFAVPNDDHLSMTIDPSYAGLIIGVTLITSDGTTTRSYRRLEPAVVDSLNDQPEPVDVTNVHVDTPDAVLAALRFDLVDGTTLTNDILVYERE